MNGVFHTNHEIIVDSCGGGDENYYAYKVVDTNCTSDLRLYHRFLCPIPRPLELRAFFQGVLHSALLCILDECVDIWSLHTKCPHTKCPHTAALWGPYV